MDLILSELSNLFLQHLDEGWVQAVYSSEFLDFGELPPEYEITLDNNSLSVILTNIMKSCDAWLNLEFLSHEEKSWAALSHQVPYKKLLALIGYYIDLGIKNVANKEKRNNALMASLLYYKLLSIPGYKAYHIYHSQIFVLSLACLGFPKAMCDNEYNFLNAKELTREVNSVIDGLKQFVMVLKIVIEQLQLNPSDMNFEDILSNMIDIIGCAIVNKLNVDKIELGKVSSVIYEMIDILLCDVNREPNPAAIRLLFKCLLPKFISASTDYRSVNNIVRASYVTYSGLLLSKYGKAALPGYSVLLQHLCYTLEGLERAEVRNSRVSLIVGLMSLLPKKSHRKTVKWVLKLSTTSKVAHRHIAMEILSNLLSSDLEESKLENEDSPKNNQPNGRDNENADDNIENVADNDENQVIHENGARPEDTVTTEDESSQDTFMEIPDQEVIEEDMAGLLRQRSHTVRHSELLRAIYERLNDVSSTLRARAFSIITECVTHERQHVRDAVKEVQGARGEACRLVAAAARGVCDERAAVRRAALSLLQRVLAAHHTAPVDADLALLVGLCRDASIIVRSAAIAALGEMVTQIPTEAVFDAFLAGPMHQLSDPENKVQEQVVTQIQQLLTDRIDTFVSNQFSPVPWMFLDGITRHNMRRHLQKACTLLSKTSNCINHRLVDVVSTHLGAADDRRDLQCLVLLTGVARLVDYSDIGFVLDYYYKLADDTEERDVRLMPLTVELLSVWSRFASNEQRHALREHLVRRLATSEDETSRIPIATLAAQLDPENLQWATEMMQLSEQRAASGADVREWLRAADLALVSPAPPAPSLMQLFLDALANPPPEWDGAEMGACVAGAGRLCVRARGAACRAAPRFAALLRDCAAPTAARLNALLVLTDICTRYTSIVEPLLECVCGCLSRESPPELRRAAARALTRLLLAGFLRLRTPLYYKYCALLADEDNDVREPAEYYMTCCLTTETIFHHFVDCVLYYNNETEKMSFDARQLIYDVMLQRMSLVQRLNAQCRLAREVLQHAADLTDEGAGELPPALHAALLDTITVLCGPRMKLPRKPMANGEPADIDDLQERVTTNIVSHKMKRTVAEVVVPAVLRLYSRLRLRGGQLAAYLVKLATDLLNDYRHEIEELIENDEELVERINQFQETIGIESSFGNTRNLVTTSAPPDPETPRAPRRKAPRQYKGPPKKRALKI